MLWKKGTEWHHEFTFTHDHISKVTAWVSFRQLHCGTGNMWDRHLIMKLANKVRNVHKYITAWREFGSCVLATVCLEADLSNLLLSCTPLGEFE